LQVQLADCSVQLFKADKDFDVHVNRQSCFDPFADHDKLGVLSKVFIALFFSKPSILGLLHLHIDCNGFFFSFFGFI